MQKQKVVTHEQITKEFGHLVGTKFNCPGDGGVATWKILGFDEKGYATIEPVAYDKTAPMKSEKASGSIGMFYGTWYVNPFYLR